MGIDNFDGWRFIFKAFDDWWQTISAFNGWRLIGNIFYVLKQILSFLFFLIIKNECYVSILRILGLNHIRLLRQYLVHF